MTRKIDDLEEALPRGARPCVWMSAGLVAYRLCDRDFDCEGCPFDEAMGGAHAPAADGARPGPWVFPDDRLYHASHVWALRLPDGITRIGLDVYAARGAGEVTTVILPEAGKHLLAGQVAGWTVDRSVAVPFLAPVEGTVVRRNPVAMREPSMLAAAPYDDGWLVDVREEGRRVKRSLLEASEIGRRAGAELARLQERVARELDGTEHDVGPTLQDGGDLLGDLRRRLGSRRFHDLLSRSGAGTPRRPKRTR